GHLYLAAYLPGVLCLAATAIGTYKLATLALRNVQPATRIRTALCWVLGAFAAADLGLVWGAMSGLEPALSAALVVWAIYFLILEESPGHLRWTLLLVALLPWARPDLLAITAGGALWLSLRALRASNRAQALQ